MKVEGLNGEVCISQVDCSSSYTRFSNYLKLKHGVTQLSHITDGVRFKTLFCRQTSRLSHGGTQLVLFFRKL